MNEGIKVVGKTKGGKELGYRVPEGEHLYEACFTSGGEVPKELQGRWNDIKQLTHKIEGYLNKSEKKSK